MIITFCGHSTYLKSFEDEERLLNHIQAVACNNQVNFYLGGYGNFDNFALNCARKYKEQHKSAKILFIAPYLGKWLDTRRDFLEKNYDGIIYPQIENIPQKLAIIKRNEWIVEQADYVFAYVKTHYGGAYKTLLYAHKRKKNYTNLYQGNFELF